MVDDSTLYIVLEKIKRIGIEKLDNLDNNNLDRYRWYIARWYFFKKCYDINDMHYWR